jgi:diguanylate cyclase
MMVQNLSNHFGSSSSIKVLIVEKEHIAAETIANHLRQQGYTLAGIVHSGEAAIQQAFATSPDIVLIDIMLEGIVDGITAAGRIWTELHCPVVYMSACADNETLTRVKQTNPYGYLVKPFRSDALKMTIEVALQRHRVDQETQTRHLAQLKCTEDKLNQLLCRDPLTNLLNRYSLQERFDQLTRSLLPGPQISLHETIIEPLVPVLCLSLDRFDRISQHLGYATSDRLLQILAERFVAYVGEGGLVSRTDMNEFVLVLPPIDYRGHLTAIAQDLLQLIAQPILTEYQEVFVTASLGATLYPKDGEDMEVLIRRSRRVMPRQGGGRFEIYTPLYKTDSLNQLTIETELHYALEREELEVHYQPKVHVRTGKVIGAEALIRWTHGKYGSVPPTQFIPVAEETGLIHPIGEWVFQTACRQLREWQNDGFSVMRMAINLSGYQLQQAGLQQRLTKIVLDTGLSPQAIELELTESALVEDIDLANRRLKTLKALGFRIAIDDFGMGYSSLGHLHQLSFDILKLDRSFVQDINLNPKNAAIATAIISMAHQLHLKVVAEGVETHGELAFLHENQCDELQGYLFSRPLPAQEFAALIRSGKSLPSQ